MKPDPRFAIEVHRRCAALYLHGALCSSAAVGAARACEDIPACVRALRVDLRGVRLLDPGALDLFATLLGDWRRRREATLRVELPRERTFVSLDGRTVGLPRPFARADPARPSRAPR